MKRYVFISPDDAKDAAARAATAYAATRMSAGSAACAAAYSAVCRAGGFDGVFIGDEVCGGFLSFPGFADVINRLAADGLNAGIVAPYLTPEREELFTALLDAVISPTEIVVNDAGAFLLVNKSRHIPILGRLLTRQNTDPAIFSFYQNRPERIVYDYMDVVKLVHKDPPRALTEHFKSSPLFSKEAAELFLSGRDTLTVMMDMPPCGLPESIPERYGVMLNTDDVLVSVLPCRSCDGCPKTETLLGRARADIPIYRKKNLCYYKRADVPGLSDTGVPAYVTRYISRRQ